VARLLLDRRHQCSSDTARPVSLLDHELAHLPNGRVVFEREPHLKAGETDDFAGDHRSELDVCFARQQSLEPPPNIGDRCRVSELSQQIRDHPRVLDLDEPDLEGAVAHRL